MSEGVCIKWSAGSFNSPHHSYCFILHRSRRDHLLARPYDAFCQRLCYFYNNETWANPHCGEVIIPGISPKQTQQASVMLWLRKLRAAGRLLVNGISDSVTLVEECITKLLNGTSWCAITPSQKCLLCYGNTVYWTGSYAGDMKWSQKWTDALNYWTHCSDPSWGVPFL